MVSLLKISRMTYNDIDSNKKAFVFELDNVLFPEKDYLLQVYYLFASFLEYTELLDAKALLNLMTETYYNKGPGSVFNEVQHKFKLDEKYRTNFEHLMLNAKLPLPLLLYKEMLNLLQDIIVDRKQLFIVTKGNPHLQLNKIKHIEWHGMDAYLICYFADEFGIEPVSFVQDKLLKDNGLVIDDILMIGPGKNVAEIEGTRIPYTSVESFLTSH